MNQLHVRNNFFLIFVKFFQFQRKFSLYDYVASILCAFILTLNEEQFEEAEEFLFDKLFSSDPIKALMASDIICFMCRVSKPFALDMAEVLFKTMSEIWFEDVKTASSEHQSILQVLQFTYQILLNLSKRIFKFIDKAHFDKLDQSCPHRTNLMIWNNFDFKVEDIIVPKNKRVHYEKIYNHTKFIDVKPDDSIIYSLVKNFFNSTNEYDALLHLRLLSNIKTFLSYSNFNSIVFKIKNLLLSSNQLSQYRLEFSIGCLKLLNALANAKDENYKKSSFNINLYQVIVALFDECNNDFVSKLYYFATLPNIFQNPLFANILANLKDSRIKTYLIFQIKYYQDKKSLLQDEKEIYMKQLYKTDELSILFEARYKYIDSEIKDIPIDELSFDHFNLFRRNENLSVVKNEQLFKEFCLFIEKMKNIHFANDEERQKFMLLYNELGEIFKQK